VEWYDTTGKMISQTAAPLFQSTAKGAFELPEDYKGNFIRVKAYTQWSLNDEPEFRYTRDIVINNSIEPDMNRINVLKTTVTNVMVVFLIQHIIPIPHFFFTHNRSRSFEHILSNGKRLHHVV